MATGLTAYLLAVSHQFKGNSSVMFEPYNEPHLGDVTITAAPLGLLARRRLHREGQQ